MPDPTDIVFNQAKLMLFQGSLGLGSNSFYVHLVTTAPISATLETVSQISIVTGGNYSLKPVTGSKFLLQGEYVLWTFNNPTWPKLTTDNTNTIKGLVTCKQMGGSPSSTDKLICYNSLEIPYTPNGYNFTAQVPLEGVLSGY